MTDRDHFAAAALTGLLARPVEIQDPASSAYVIADAMLEERERVTLTADERKAILDAARAYELDSDEEECAAIAATLRALLKRLA